MSSYFALHRISQELRSMLWNAFDQALADDPLFTLDVIKEMTDITFNNPKETAENHDQFRLSLWLYQITENEFLKNQPRQRANGQDTLRYPPLSLNLYYLVTPFAGEHNHILLGKTMQVMHDNPIFWIRDEDEKTYEELRIALCRLTLEELTRIWEALRESYRLSVCYQVRVTCIDSERITTTGRVLDRAAGYVPPGGR